MHACGCCRLNLIWGQHRAVSNHDAMNPLPRESLRRKRSARLAAIQGLYQYAMADYTPNIERLCETLSLQWKDSKATHDPDWPADDLPENALMRDIIAGTMEHITDIDNVLTSVIKDNWRPERLDPVMRSILRCAAYELQYQPKRHAAMLLDEYVSLASGFFDEAELGYIHSALQRLVPTLRPEAATPNDA